jgi:hypothetical protein
MAINIKNSGKTPCAIFRSASKIRGVFVEPLSSSFTPIGAYIPAVAITHKERKTRNKGQSAGSEQWRAVCRVGA